MRTRKLWACAPLALLACAGEIGVPDEPAGPEPGAAGPVPAPGLPAPAGAPAPPPVAPPPPAPAAGCGPLATPLRRLNHFELDNTGRDLLGETIRVSSGFPADDRVLGFDNAASGLTVHPLLAEKYLTASELLSERATANLPRLLGCDPARTGEEACVRPFIQRFGQRAWRRPLTADELAALERTYARGRAAGDVRLGVQYLLQRLLQSPHFLYRMELGGTPEPGGRVRLTPWEIASRLSYALWASLPDEALFAAAASGALAREAEIAAQARRLLAAPRACEVMVRFHEQWLKLEEIDRTVKDDKAFPGFTSEVRAALRLSTRRLIEEAVFEGGDLRTLLTASWGWVNEKTAPLFGITSASPKELVRVELDPGQRAGLLTHPLVLAITAKAAATSPVRRGVYVREHVLGMDLPPPLPDVNTNVPSAGPDATTRERFVQHARDPACAGCHALIDPIGFGFETYDPVGRWRTTERGRPIDARGELVAADVAGPFDGAVQLARRLADSGQVRAFAVTQLFRYTFGRPETEEDACTLARLNEAFGRRGHRLLDLLVTIAESDLFRYRAGGTP